MSKDPIKRIRQLVSSWSTTHSTSLILFQFLVQHMQQTSSVQDIIQLDRDLTRVQSSMNQFRTILNDFATLISQQRTSLRTLSFSHFNRTTATSTSTSTSTSIPPPSFTDSSSILTTLLLPTSLSPCDIITLATRYASALETEYQTRELILSSVRATVMGITTIASCAHQSSSSSSLLSDPSPSPSPCLITAEQSLTLATYLSAWTCQSQLDPPLIAHMDRCLLLPRQPS